MNTIRIKHIFGFLYLIIVMSWNTASLAEVELVDLVNITDSPAPVSESTVGWSPDGTEIIFARGCDYTAGGPGTGIWSMTALPGSTPMEIYSVTARVNLNWPDWSPDGTKIFYVWDVVGGGDIWLIDSDGIGPPTCIACESLMEYQPDWSPTGDKIVYARGIYNYEPVNIWVMDQDGSNKQQLTFGLADTAPEWSPDGTKIAFTRKLNRYEGYNQIYIMNSDGSNIVQLTFDDCHSGAPTWSPDGAFIAFVSDKDGALWPGDLWVMKNDGSEGKRLTTMGGVFFPKWSSADNIIAFQWYGGGSCNEEIFFAYLSINSPPVADAGFDQTVSVGTDCMASVTLDGSGSYDPDEDPLTYTWLWDDGSGIQVATGITPNIEFPLGSFTITLVVNNGTIDSDPDTVEIAVMDDSPPTMVLLANPDTLWPPNHKMRLVNVDIDALDNCDLTPACQIISVTSNEPENGLGDGDTAPDWEIVSDTTVKLRSERSGVGNGRIYTIFVECMDDAENSTVGTVEVYVPHDKGKK